jgi:hypothetical protein
MGTVGDDWGFVVVKRSEAIEKQFERGRRINHVTVVGRN